MPSPSPDPVADPAAAEVVADIFTMLDANIETVLRALQLSSGPPSAAALETATPPLTPEPEATVTLVGAHPGEAGAGPVGPHG